MLSGAPWGAWSGQVKIFLCLEATDMRKSFDSLAALVQEQLELDPLSGHLFVFRSRRADRVKLLYWEADGYALWYKRLEAGTFRFPVRPQEGQRSLSISAADLAMLLDGVDLASVKRTKRYRRAACATS
jgi:transposase